jgi:hypothetical protein
MRATVFALGVIVCAACASGCGKGPHHLPEAEFNAGKAALEDLDRAASARDDESKRAWRNAADAQMSNIESSNQALYLALSNYSLAQGTRDEFELYLRSTERELQNAKTHQAEEKIYPALTSFEKAVASSDVLIKTCRDDAAQWFLADVAATNTCRSELDRINKKRDRK